MSSHHFVKEDQEPALLIIDADGIAFEKVQELLEWSPLIIVSHSALEKVQQWGIKIDVVLASSMGDELTQIAFDQSPIHIINTSGGKNELESTYQFLLDRKQVNLNVIKKEASTLFQIASAYSKKVNIVLFDGTSRWHFVTNGSYSKWLPGQSTIKTFINNKIEINVVENAGIFRIEHPYDFWVGEEF